jgi:hypothetical protein
MFPLYAVLSMGVLRREVVLPYFQLKCVSTRSGIAHTCNINYIWSMGKLSGVAKSFSEALFINHMVTPYWIAPHSSVCRLRLYLGFIATARFI